MKKKDNRAVKILVRINHPKTRKRALKLVNKLAKILSK